MQFDTPIRFAVVGLGNIGQRHAEQATKTPGLALAAVCDANTDAIARFKRELPSQDVAVFEDYDQMLAQGGFDVVVIATTSHLHAPMSIKASNRGCHVLVEKPMAHTAEQARKMIAAAQKAQRFITVHQSMRYQPDTLMVKRVIESGKIGKVFQVYRGTNGFKQRKDWQIWKEFGGGILANWGSHLVDAALLMIDHEPQTVFSQLNQIHPNGDADDCFSVTVRYAGGQMAQTEVLQAFFGKPMWHVCGTQGSIVIADAPPVITMQVRTSAGEQWSEQYDFGPDLGNVPPYYQDLSEHLMAGREPPVTPKSVLQTVIVLEAARQSDASGQSVSMTV